MENKPSIFREKSLQRISSPEEMQDYIRVTRPAVWVILAAVILLLAGMIVWAVFGTVTVHDADGTARQIHPILYILN